jgi:hypothetical protein
MMCFLELASIYSNRIQIAFKPHPLLRVKLEQDPKWKSKKPAYYSTWDERSVRKWRLY